jgi:hypothetical protein
MSLLLTHGGERAQQGNHRRKWRHSQPTPLPQIAHICRRSTSSSTIKINTDKPKPKKMNIDSEDEIEAIIEDELAHLCQENERLRLTQEHMARQRMVMKKAQIM